MLSECDLHCLDKIWPLRLPLHTIRANIFRTRKDFPVSNADALTGFLALCTAHGWCSLTMYNQLILFSKADYILMNTMPISLNRDTGRNGYL